MKKTLLVILFFSFAAMGFSQSSPDGSEGGFYAPETAYQQPSVTVYPNPATQFISIDNDDDIRSMSVFNLVGRKLKSFQNVHKNERYDISDLPNGIYLIRIQGANEKIIATQRINKK